MDKMRKSLEFIDRHPRIILLMAWPVISIMIIGVIMIVWMGGWLVLPAIQLAQLSILGNISLGLIGILLLNQLAQSSTFFGKIGLKLGNVFDASAEMDKQPDVTPEEEPK